MTKVSCEKHNLCHKSRKHYKIKEIGIHYVLRAVLSYVIFPLTKSILIWYAHIK
jgi:hypothetical protein